MSWEEYKTKNSQIKTQNTTSSLSSWETYKKKKEQEKKLNEKEFLIESNKKANINNVDGEKVSNNSTNKNEAIKNINSNKQLSPEMKKTLIQSLNNEQTNNITENKTTELNQKNTVLKNAGELIKTPISDIIGDNELHDIKYLEKELGTSDSFFETSEAFKDGYQLGDVTKTVGSTIGDVGLHAVKGISNLGEGIGDLIVYGEAQIADMKGNTEKANQLRENAKKNMVDEWFEPATKAVNKNSVLGNKSDELAEGLGYVAGMTAVSIVSGGAGAKLGLSSEVAATIGSTATTFSSSMGNGMSEAYQNGATDEEAFWYGVISGAGEAGSELMFGGLGKASGAIGLTKGVGEFDDQIAKSLTKNIKNKMVKTLIQSGVKAAGEGAEEVVSGLISAVGKKATYMSDEDLQSIIKDENLAEQFWMGALTSAIAQGPSTIKSVKNGTDFITGYTENEQKVYDTLTENKANEEITKKTVDNMINEQKETLEKAYGRELTADELTEIENAVNAVKESGKLNTENTKLSKKERGAIEENIKEDLENGNLKLETIKEILGEDANIDNDSFLQRSVYENEQKYSNYKAEFTGNEKVDKLLQSAVDSGVNNTSKTRKMVDVISKLVENTDRQYRFVNQEQLKKMGYNENANGLTDKSTGEILLSVNSNKQIEAVVGHETTHLFDSKVNGEYTQEYKDLQNSVTEYLKSNGTYEAKIKEIMDTYTKAGITLTQEQLMEEITADTIGDNLFGENADAFINQLTTNRNVFQRIYDYIKNLVKKLKGTKNVDISSLEKLEDKFTEVWKTLNKTETDTDVKYSMGGIKGLQNMDDSQKRLELYEQYKEAKRMVKEHKSNEEIWKKTHWIKDATTGELKFYFSDAGLDVISKNYVAGREYDLKNMIKHDLLFELYPQLKDYKVIIEDKNQNSNKNNTYIRGGYNRYNDKIRLDYRLFNNKKEVEKTLAHEIQHAIQKIEKFSKGASTEWGNKFYKKSPGEKEARLTANRMLDEKYNGKDFSNKIPKYANDYISMLEKMKISLYNYLKDLRYGGKNNDIEKNVEQNNEKNSRHDELKSMDRRLNNKENEDIRFSMTKSNTDQYWKKQTIDNDVGNISNTENSEQGSFNLPKNIENDVGDYNNKTIEDVLKQTPEEKQNGMKLKAKNYISRSRSNFINNIVNNFGTSKLANTKTLNDVTERIRQDITNNGTLSTEQKNSYFNELYDNLVKIDTEYYDTYKDVKNDIRKTKLFIDNTIRSDITDFDNFRKANMGNIIMTSDSSNISIDKYYKELSNAYPELFPDDIINPTQQLERIADVTKDITKVETNVAAYNDANLGKDYRYWARETFDKDIDKFSNDIKMAERYNSESKTTEKLGITKDLVKELYKQLPSSRIKYEKVSAKEVLTQRDRVQVDRLLNNEISIDEIPADCNKQGIIKLATAKADYDGLQKAIKEYQTEIKNKRIEEARKDVGNLESWKDKKIGFQYSRETPIRNIYDVAPKNVADTIVNKYFRPYIETNEKSVVSETNNYFDRVRELELSDTKKYKIDFEGSNKKVSESTLVQLLGENKISTEQIKEAGADVTKISNAVNEFRNIYNELFEKINESMLDNGYAPVEYRKDYFPHFTETTTDTLLGKAAKLLGIDITNREELPTDIAGQSYKFKPGRTWFGNLLQRTTDATDYDAKKGFEKYVKGAMDLIYHTGDIQNLRALSTAIRTTYNQTEIANQVAEINESTMSDYDKAVAIEEIYNQAKDRSHLSKFVEWLDNYTNLLAGKKAINDRGAEKELNRQMYKTMTDIESRIAANAIGGNVGVSLTNFAPLAQAWGEVKTHNLVNGIWQTMKATLKGDSSFASESQFITRRRGIDSLTETTLNKITKPLDTILGFADNFTSEAIVRAKYNQNLQEGMNRQQALEEADRYVAGLMADRGRGALPTQFSNKNPIAKMINMFQVEVNNQWSYYLKDLPKNMQEKANNNKAKVIKNTAIAYTKVMVGSYLINELLGSIRGNSTRVLPDPIYIIKELINGLTDDDDDNDDDAVIETLTEVAGNVPFVSLPATLFADSLGLDVGDIGRVSVSGAIPNISDIVSDLMDKDKTGSEKAKSIGGELLDTVGSSLVLPYGGSQIKKTVKGLSLYNNELPGSYTDSGDLRYTVDDDLKSKVQAGIFGAWANPYAQDYVDSGYKTISKKNIDEMVGLDMNSSEYREFRKGLSAAGTKTEDKLNYIDASDLTTEQKNLVANNLNSNSKKSIDMEDYGDYNSYEEYKYSRDYPEKYNVIKQIDSYDNFEKYKDDISNIKKQYSTDNGYSTSQRKSAVQSYIEGLDLNMYQKMMLEHEAGGYSIKEYSNYIQEYLDSTDLTDNEKYYIWEELFEKEE